MADERPIIRSRGGNIVDYQSVRLGDSMPPACDGGEVLYHAYGAQLRRSPAGDYVLNVLCGRIAQYGLELVLTPAEVSRYQGDSGDEFIHDLGEDVYHDPDAFRSRSRQL